MTASGYTIKEVLKGLNLLMDCVQGAEKELKSQGSLLGFQPENDHCWYKLLRRGRLGKGHI